MSKIQCLLCEDIIESLHVHDYKHCKCGDAMIDGGNSYLRYGAKDLSTIKVIETPEAALARIAKAPLG